MGSLAIGWGALGYGDLATAGFVGAAILAFIRQARGLGLSLEAISEILSLAENEAPCSRTNALLDQRLDEIDRAIADLTHLRATITAAKQAPARTDGVRCRVIEHANIN